MHDAFVDIQHSDYASGVVGTHGNLEMRNDERRGMARLAFNDIGLVGLVGDVDTGHARDATRNDIVCADHLWGSLRKDLRVVL